jgi:hypothetical protein
LIVFSFDRTVNRLTFFDGDTLEPSVIKGLATSVDGFELVFRGYELGPLTWNFFLFTHSKSPSEIKVVRVKTVWDEPNSSVALTTTGRDLTFSNGDWGTVNGGTNYYWDF